MFTNKEIHAAVLSVFKTHGMTLRINLPAVVALAIQALNLADDKEYSPLSKRITNYIRTSNKRGGRYGLASGKKGGCYLRANDPHKKYTVLLIALNGNETFTLSRATNLTKKTGLFRFMRKEGQVSKDAMDTLLLFKNGVTSPEVVGFWRAANGDFEGL